MELKKIKPTHRLKRKKRIGRGGKKGTYSGKGLGGQKRRAGRRLKPSIRTFIKKYPKLRGYKFKPQKKELIVVNIDTIEKKFKKDQIINPENLIKKKLIRRIKGKVPRVKILGRGKLTKKIIIKDCEISRGARKKIEEAGGEIK